MRVAASVAAVLVSAVLGAAGVAAEGVKTREPVPLAGAALKNPSNLHLLVANNPPFILDVDTGQVSPIRAPAVMKKGVLWVVAVAGQAGVIVLDVSYPKAQIYVLRGRGTRPTFLGRGRDVVPSRDGRSVWIKSVNTSACLLRQVALNGHQVGQAQPFACNTTIDYGGSLGLVVNRTRLIDPRTRQTLLRTPYGILAAAGKRLVLAGPGKEFTLLDTHTGSKRTLPWPSILYGLDAPSADYQGRYVALAFADPAWQGGPSQAMDVWSLDTQTGALSHVPGMPALVDLKFTSMQWTRDGRLVFLAETDGKAQVAIWKPGAAKLEVKRVRIPQRTSGSDSFALLP
jgi:hypothetical protein